MNVENFYATWNLVEVCTLTNLMALASELGNICFDDQTVDFSEDEFFTLVETIYEKVSLLRKWDPSEQEEHSDIPTDNLSDSEDDSATEFGLTSQKDRRAPDVDNWTEDGMMNFHLGEL